jgi:hypothetical protein
MKNPNTTKQHPKAKAEATFVDFVTVAAFAFVVWSVLDELRPFFALKGL